MEGSEGIKNDEFSQAISQHNMEKEQLEQSKKVTKCATERAREMLFLFLKEEEEMRAKLITTADSRRFFK